MRVYLDELSGAVSDPHDWLLNMKQVTAGETNGEEPRMGEFLRCGVRLLGILISLGSRFRQCAGAKYLTDAPFAA